MNGVIMDNTKEDLKLNAQIYSGAALILGTGFCLGAAFGMWHGYNRGIEVGKSSIILEKLAEAGMEAVK